MTEIALMPASPTATTSEARRFTRFVALGAIAALVNWSSRFALSLALPFELAVPVAYVCGMVVAFALFRRYVFPASPTPLRRQVAMFVLVNIAGVVQVWVVSVLLVRYALPAIGRDGEFWRGIAHGIAIGVPTLSSYVGHKFLTFRG